MTNYRRPWHWRRQNFGSGGQLATKRLPRDFGGEIGVDPRSGGAKGSQCFSQKINEKLQVLGKILQFLLILTKILRFYQNSLNLQSNLAQLLDNNQKN